MQHNYIKTAHSNEEPKTNTLKKQAVKKIEIKGKESPKRPQQNWRGRGI